MKLTLCSSSPISVLASLESLCTSSPVSTVCVCEFPTSVSAFDLDQLTASWLDWIRSTLPLTSPYSNSVSLFATCSPVQWNKSSPWNGLTSPCSLCVLFLLCWLFWKSFWVWVFFYLFINFYFFLGYTKEYWFDITSNSSLLLFSSPCWVLTWTWVSNSYKQLQHNRQQVQTALTYTFPLTKYGLFSRFCLRQGTFPSNFSTCSLSWNYSFFCQCYEVINLRNFPRSVIIFLRLLDVLWASFLSFLSIVVSL